MDITVNQTVPVSNNNTAVELQELYAAGKRQFPNLQLERANLVDIFLSRADLTGANLNYANLQNFDLSDGSLQASSLIGADLSHAHLSGVDLTNANLSKANLTMAILTMADLTGACLANTCLKWSVLSEADLSHTDLSGTCLAEVDLKTTKIQGAIYSDDTIFPADFDPVNRGLFKNFISLGQYTIEHLITQFEKLCSISNKYLGDKMTSKYFDSSRPDLAWLRQFKIDQSDQSSKITFQGGLDESVDESQLLSFQQWMNSFVKSCSTLIRDFPKLILEK